MKPFSFVHVADVHLGYAQYNLEERRRDFSEAFRQVVDLTLELKPNFMIIAGDLFDDPRPGNVILSFSVQQLKRLKDANIPVLATNGSHDYSPNVLTGTILAPLDEAGLLHFLPRHEGASWGSDYCYVYGIRNFRTKLALERELQRYYEEHPPKAESPFNICVFHQSVDHPEVFPSAYAEMKFNQLPAGFQYYAAGNVHKPIRLEISGSLLAYPGPTETTSYAEAEFKKGFYFVELTQDNIVNSQRIPLETREFSILRKDFSALEPVKVTEEARSIVAQSEKEGEVLVLILKGILPKGFRGFDVDQSSIQSTASKALYVHVINKMQEAGLEEKIPLPSQADLRGRAKTYFLEVLKENYGEDGANSLAQALIHFVELLKAGDLKSVKEKIEEVLRAEAE